MVAPELRGSQRFFWAGLAGFGRAGWDRVQGCVRGGPSWECQPSWEPVDRPGGNPLVVLGGASRPGNRLTVLGEPTGRPGGSNRPGSLLTVLGVPTVRHGSH